MQKKMILALTCGVTCLSACASTPDVTATYYLPKASTTVTVTQSVLCDSDKIRILAVNSASKVTTYVADTTRPNTFSYKALDGAFADTNSALSLTEDGRLKGVNVTSAGKGDEIAKTAIALASLVLPLAADESSATKRCANIDKWGGGKPVPLTWQATVDHSKATASPIAFQPDEGSADLVSAFFGDVRPLVLVVEPPTAIDTRFTYKAGWADRTATVRLPQLQTVKLVAKFDDKAFWSGAVTTPSSTAPYELPIPKSALFGKQAFALQLSEAGAVTGLTYGKDSGAAGVGGVVNAAANELVTTDAEQAAKIKAKADILAQQQRLLLCQKDPASCKT